MVAVAVAACSSEGDPSSQSAESAASSANTAATVADPAVAQTTVASDPDTTTATTASTQPTVVTLVLTGPSPMPSNEQVNSDLDDHCTRLYDIVADMALGQYVPAVAKALGRDDGTDHKVGCEMYFGTPPQPGAVIHDDDFVIALTSEPLTHRNVTNDADEARVSLTSGRVAFVDPTGDDGVGYDDVRVVTVPQADGGVAFVMGFKGTPLDVTVTIADEFDRALAAAKG
ncbi:MAG: hypothetical protein AAB131_09085 [Actinomycetota bacterium]